jgi:hypothetical protein
MTPNRGMNSGQHSFAERHSNRLRLDGRHCDMIIRSPEQPSFRWQYRDTPSSNSKSLPTAAVLVNSLSRAVATTARTPLESRKPHDILLRHASEQSLHVGCDDRAARPIVCSQRVDQVGKRAWRLDALPDVAAGLQLLPARDLSCNSLSTARRQTGVLVHVHPVLPWNPEVSATSVSSVRTGWTTY